MARTVVGLDLGSTGIRAAEVALGRKGSTRLRRWASIPLPPGVVEGGAVRDPDALAPLLRRLWSEAKFSTRSVVLGIGSGSVLVRQVDLAWMSPQDLRKALRYQVADLLPVPADEANIDYTLLTEYDATAESGMPQRMARILLVVAARDLVDGQVRAVQAAGLRPERADLSAFALARVGAAADGATEAVLDLGAEQTTLVLHRGGQPRFVRVVDGHGSATVTRALMERYSWSFADAERTKTAVGLPDRAAAGVLVHPAQEVVEEQVGRLLDEIASTLDYVVESAPDSRPDGLVLTGAGARLPGLAATLERLLGLPVRTLEVRPEGATGAPLQVSGPAPAGLLDGLPPEASDLPPLGEDDHRRAMALAYGLGLAVAC